MISPRTFVNKAGVEYDATKNTIIFAEDLNNMNANISELSEDIGNIPVPPVSALKITYSGSPQTPFILPITMNSIAVVPVASVGGQATYTALNGPTITNFSYTELSWIMGSYISRLSFDDLVGVSGIFNPSALGYLDGLYANELVSIGGSFSPSNMFSLAVFEFNKLKYVAGSFNPATFNTIVSLHFDSLEYVGGAFSPNGMTICEYLVINALKTVGGSFSPSTFPALHSLYGNNLVSIGGTFIPQSFANCENLYFNNLETVGGTFSPSNFPLVTEFSFDKLIKVGVNFSPSNMNSLEYLFVPSLQYVVGAVGISIMSKLFGINFSNMISYGTTINISASLGNITNIVLGTIGTLKSILGATINCSGQKLTSASVNGILALLVSLDGTNGTTTWGTGKALTINGGTNGAPSGQGIINKATLIARGATVTTN